MCVYLCLPYFVRQIDLHRLPNTSNPFATPNSKVNPPSRSNSSVVSPISMGSRPTNMDNQSITSSGTYEVPPMLSHMTIKEWGSQLEFLESGLQQLHWDSEEIEKELAEAIEKAAIPTSSAPHRAQALVRSKQAKKKEIDEIIKSFEADIAEAKAKALSNNELNDIDAVSEQSI